MSEKSIHIAHRASLVLLEQPSERRTFDAGRHGIDPASFHDGTHRMDKYKPVEMDSCIALL